MNESFGGYNAGMTVAQLKVLPIDWVAVVVPLDGSGTAALKVPIPDDAGLAGKRIYSRRSQPARAG